MKRRRKTLPRTSQNQEAAQSGPETTSHLRCSFSGPSPFLGPFENLDRRLPQLANSGGLFWGWYKSLCLTAVSVSRELRFSCNVASPLVSLPRLLTRSSAQICQRWEALWTKVLARVSRIGGGVCRGDSD